jgi:hypothetical protein
MKQSPTDQGKGDSMPHFVLEYSDNILEKKIDKGTYFKLVSGKLY